MNTRTSIRTLLATLAVVALSAVPCHAQLFGGGGLLGGGGGFRGGGFGGGLGGGRPILGGPAVGTRPLPSRLSWVAAQSLLARLEAFFPAAVVLAWEIGPAVAIFPRLADYRPSIRRSCLASCVPVSPSIGIA